MQNLKVLFIFLTNYRFIITFFGTTVSLMFSAQMYEKARRCARALEGRDDVGERDSSEYKCHVANRDNRDNCAGNSCPCPGSDAQDGHLQPTCQRAAANAVADNW